MDEVTNSGTGDRINDWVTPRFFAQMAAKKKTAEELGPAIDYTLSSGYSSGDGQEISPVLAQREQTW